MNEQELKGKGKRIKGKIQEEAGKLIKNRKGQLKGKIVQVEGKIEEEIGKSRRNSKK